MEVYLAAHRAAAATSLCIDDYVLDKKFADNCTDERIKELQDSVRLINVQQAADMGEIAERITALPQQ